MAIPANPATAANAYAALGRLGTDPGGMARPGDAAAGGPSFSTVLKDVMHAVTDAGAKADAQTQAVATGKANMVDVVTAVAESETAIATLVSVRDKVIAAYQDILKMPI
ncbi:MAG: flagellar hook-basal body complex protein FliE [Xanthobacteraceae bacterium]